MSRAPKDIDVAHYASLIQGGASFTEIRKQLFEVGLSQREVAIRIEEIDDYLLSSVAVKADKRARISWHAASIVLILFGIIAVLSFFIMRIHSFVILTLGIASVTTGFTLLFRRRDFSGTPSDKQRIKRRFKSGV